MATIRNKTLNKALSSLIICAIGLVGFTYTAAAQANDTQADYRYVALASGALNIDGQTFLPLRSTFNSMDMDVIWRADGQNKIKLINGEETYEMNLNAAGNSVTIANGANYPLRIANGTSYVPMSLLQDVVNREIGLSGTQVLVLVDHDPNWQQISGTWENQKPLWAGMNAYQGPQAVTAPPTTTNAAATAPTPVEAKPATAVTPQASPTVSTGDALIWPTTATYVSSPFGERVYPLGDGVAKDFHTGVDIAGRAGDPIFAAANGTVTRAEWFSSYGNCIDITHPSGLVTRYAHLAGMNVSVGQTVAQGQVIGSQGMTGAATGAHLHFETRVNDKAIDPNTYIKYHK